MMGAKRAGQSSRPLSVVLAIGLTQRRAFCPLRVEPNVRKGSKASIAPGDAQVVRPGYQVSDDRLASANQLGAGSFAGEAGSTVTMGRCAVRRSSDQATASRARLVSGIDTVLAGWLTHRIGGDGLVILLGDHQPPAIVGGEPQPPWTVPIHVLSRDPELVALFLAEGYVSSLVPTQAPPHRGMETFLARFLAGFDRPG
jgi:hypothetical protein